MGLTDGISAVTYALMLSIMAVVLVSAFYFLHDRINSSFNSDGICIDNPAGCTSGGSGGGGGNPSATTTTVPASGP